MISFTVFSILVATNIFGQESKFYDLFKLHSKNEPSSTISYTDKLILRADLGFSTGSFKIKNDNTGMLSTVRFKSNTPIIFGIGAIYKGLSGKINFSTPIMLKNEEYGKSTFFNIKFNYIYRNFLFEIDFHNYLGYTIPEALSFKDPSEVYGNNTFYQNNTRHRSLTLSAYHLFDKSIHLPSIYGISTVANSDSYSYYVKYTAAQTAYLNGKDPILPLELQDINDSKQAARKFSSFDLGAMGGICAIRKFDNWQVSCMAGLGFVIQEKAYHTANLSRHFLGLSPRYDFKLIGGYSVDKWFVMLYTELDNKATRFNDFKIRSNFFSVQATAGIRI